MPSKRRTSSVRRQSVKTQRKAKRSRSRSRLSRKRQSKSKSISSRSRRARKYVSKSKLGSSKNVLLLNKVKFDQYIKKVLKRVSPRNTLTTDAVKAMDSIMKSIFHQIGSETSNRMGRRKVMKPKLINRAMRRFVPERIRNEANMKGLEAVDKYSKSLQKK